MKKNLFLFLIIVTSMGALGQNNVFPTPGGNVGIGTTLPAEKLHVYRNQSGYYNPLVVIEDGITNGYTQFAMKGTGRQYHLGVGNASETGFGLANKFYLWDQNAVTPRFVLDASGNISIGTTSATAQFHTTGTVRFAGLGLNNSLTRVMVTDANGNISYRDASTLGGNQSPLTDSLLRLEPLNVSSSSGFPRGIELTSNTGYWQHRAEGFIGLQKRTMNVAGTGNDIDDKVGIWIKGFYTEYGGSLPIYLGGNGYASNDCKMIIQTDGRVGIGTSTMPVGYKLYVEEGIRTRKVRVDQSTWADYVFEPAYQLMPLGQVESYIKQNKHLPGVPSAKEVEENGLDLGENQSILLKKIEELTLYIIDLQNQNKRLNDRLTNIESNNAK